MTCDFDRHCIILHKHGEFFSSLIFLFSSLTKTTSFDRVIPANRVHNLSSCLNSVSNNCINKYFHITHMKTIEKCNTICEQPLQKVLSEYFCRNQHILQNKQNQVCAKCVSASRSLSLFLSLLRSSIPFIVYAFFCFQKCIFFGTWNIWYLIYCLMAAP